MIPFNKPAVTGRELAHLNSAISGGKLCGDGLYTRTCSEVLSAHLSAAEVLLTPSATHALEMAAILAEIRPLDEVIMPSYTFVSTANAFVLRGAKIVFVDIRPDTMNLDESLIEAAITKKTRAIVPVHYAGIGCEMVKINEIASARKLLVIEDAAQALNASYDGRPLGTFGSLSAFSFHETKNITSGGEGGCLAICEQSMRERAEVIREKGTNRRRFLRGQVDKYTWVDVGSSYLPSELQAAFLLAQLEALTEITNSRMRSWIRYFDGLRQLENEEAISLPVVPRSALHNAHMFYIKTRDINERTKLIEFLKSHDVQAAFHYVPLHSAPAGRKFGEFVGEDLHTTKESERLLRLPLYYGITDSQIDTVVSLIEEFYT